MKKVTICKHLWQDINEFLNTDGARFLQQKCKLCGDVKYVKIGDKNRQNGSSEKGD